LSGKKEYIIDSLNKKRISKTRDINISQRLHQGLRKLDYGDTNKMFASRQEWQTLPSWDVCGSVLEYEGHFQTPYINYVGSKNPL
jgi:hypothetical protein